MNDNDLDEALAALTSDSPDAHINRVLSVLARRLSEDDPEYEDNIATVRKALEDVVSFGQSKQHELESYQQFADSINLEKYLTSFEKAIVDQSSAWKACDLFDIDWFKHAALSNEGKQQCAARLYNLCEKYGQYSNSIWVALANNDLEALDMVSYTFKQDN
jgi:hypothetical protein